MASAVIQCRLSLSAYATFERLFQQRNMSEAEAIREAIVAWCLSSSDSGQQQTMTATATALSSADDSRQRQPAGPVAVVGQQTTTGESVQRQQRTTADGDRQRQLSSSGVAVQQTMTPTTKPLISAPSFDSPEAGPMRKTVPGWPVLPDGQ